MHDRMRCHVFKFRRMNVMIFRGAAARRMLTSSFSAYFSETLFFAKYISLLTADFYDTAED